MIPRFSTLLWTCVVIAAAFGLYMVKYQVQAIQKDIAGVTRQLEEERESLHVVAAEWAYLNQPQRLQQLADKYLPLKPFNSMQVADVDLLPFDEQMVADADPHPGLVQASLPQEGE